MQRSSDHNILDLWSLGSNTEEQSIACHDQQCGYPKIASTEPSTHREAGLQVRSKSKLLLGLRGEENHVLTFETVEDFSV